MTSGHPGAAPSCASMAAGRVLGGWLLQEQLGIGGMGTVFRAAHVRTGQLAALKVLHSLPEGSSDTAKRFRREVQALTRLEHPAIVRILAEALDHSPPFFCMELLPGGSLADRIREGRDRALPGQPILDPDWLAELALQLAEGLAVVHEARILHRDVKPMNVLLTADGQAKLGDFGLAKLHDVTALTAPNQVMGSVPYMAPEILRGEGFSERSDLYQLGATLFDAATGRPPYDTEQLIAVVGRGRLPPLPDLGSLAPEVARRLPWLAATLAKLMEDSPAARFPCAAELAVDLGRWRATGEGAGKQRGTHAVRVARPAEPAGPERAAESAKAEPATGGGAQAAAGPSRPALRRGLLVGLSLALWALCAAGLALRSLRPPAQPAVVAHPAAAGARPRPGIVAKPSLRAQAGPEPMMAPRVTVGAGRARLRFDAPFPPGARLELRSSGSNWSRTEALRKPVESLLVEGLAHGTKYACRLAADGRETPFGFSTPRRRSVAGGVALLETSGKLGEPWLGAHGELVVALWRRIEPSGRTQHVETSHSLDGGLTWARPESLASSSGTLFALALAVGAEEAVAGWKEGEPGTLDGQVCLRRRSAREGAWSGTLRMRVGRSLDGLGLLCSAGELGLLAVIDTPGPAGSRALGRAAVAPDRTALHGLEPVLDLPAGTAGNLRLALSGNRVVAAIDRRRDDRTWDLVWTRGDLSQGPGRVQAWRTSQPLADPGDNVGKFDLAALGGNVVVVYEAGGQFHTRVIAGRDGAVSPGQRLTTDDLLVSPGTLAVQGERAYLAYLACATPATPVAALRLFRTSDGRAWERLPGLDLRGGMPLQVRLACSRRGLLALILDQFEGLTLCPVPLRNGP